MPTSLLWPRALPPAPAVEHRTQFDQSQYHTPWPTVTHSSPLRCAESFARLLKKRYFLFANGPDPERRMVDGHLAARWRPRKSPPHRKIRYRVERSQAATATFEPSISPFHRPISPFVLASASVISELLFPSLATEGIAKRRGEHVTEKRQSPFSKVQQFFTERPRRARRCAEHPVSLRPVKTHRPRVCSLSGEMRRELECQKYKEKM